MAGGRVLSVAASRCRCAYARGRLSTHSRRAVADLGGRVTVEQADATALPAADGTYDAVFCYHLLHHAAHWRAAVAEAARVLVPGGRLYVVEMTARFVDSRGLRAVSRHPADGDRPDPPGVRAALHAAGLELVADRVRFHGWWLASVSRRPAEQRVVPGSR